jgi:hypothetical protein
MLGLAREARGARVSGHTGAFETAVRCMLSLSALPQASTHAHAID